MDVIRCSQYALYWDVDKDPNLKVRPLCEEKHECCPSGIMEVHRRRRSGPSDVDYVNCRHCNCEVPITTDDVGYWACTSTIMRAAMMRYVKGTPTSSIQREQTQESSTGWDTTTATPKICEVMALNYDFRSLTCEVELYGMRDFERLRKQDMAPNRWEPDDVTSDLLASIQSGPVVTFSPGAGKSGSGFARTYDDHFKIKRGVKKGAKMDEPANLLTLVRGGGSSAELGNTLHDHFQKHPESLLNRYYGFYQTKLGKDTSYTLIMQDASYHQDKRASQLKKQNAALAYTRYDLKGASRDMTKEQDPDKQFCLINGDFQTNEGNRLSMSSRQCWRLRKAVRADSTYLQHHNMIDYSLFLGVAKGRQAPDCSNTPGEPFCIKAGSYQFTISIIDYLNDLNAYKWGEDKLFWGKFQNYDSKVIAFIEEICPSNEEWEERLGTTIMIGLAGTACIAVCIVAMAVWLGFCPKKDSADGPGAELQPLRYQGNILRTTGVHSIGPGSNTDFGLRPPSQLGSQPGSGYVPSQGPANQGFGNYPAIHSPGFHGFDGGIAPPSSQPRSGPPPIGPSWGAY